MLRKNVFCYIIFCICIIAILGNSLKACETEEIKEYKEKKNCEVKECDDGSDSSGSSSNILDILFDRYPLLDKIFKILIELLYNWLAGMNISLG